MDDTLLLNPNANSAEIEAAIDRILIQIQQSRELMQRDQQEIERLKSESDALKMEAGVLQKETRSILAQLNFGG